MRIIVGMSGGVDSSVAAALLKEQGHDVTGVTMRIWNGQPLPEEKGKHGCFSPHEDEEIAGARQIAENLGIAHHVLDLRDAYQAEVLDYVRREYQAGRTPNPCLRCNRTIKFGALFESALKSGLQFDCFATGHYARASFNEKTRRYLLKKGSDTAKDQSYFLSFLSQGQLGRSLFPLGELTKAEVRQMAAGFGLAVSERPDSQDFVAGGYACLVGAMAPGPIMDKAGNVLGQHRGISHYTIGQRRGLRLGTAHPLYVTEIDPSKNAIIVGEQQDIYSDRLAASGLNWIAIEKLTGPIQVEARIRSSHQATEAAVTPAGDDRVKVQFTAPQMAITPGQAVVFYWGDIVVGGGTIDKGG